MNLQICRRIDSGNLDIEIWERGSGYTKASGTGSCAAAAAAYRLGLVENRVNVNQPGGMIQIDIQEDGTLYMTGSVGYVADISVADSFFCVEKNFFSGICCIFMTDCIPHDGDTAPFFVSKVCQMF